MATVLLGPKNGTGEVFQVAMFQGLLKLQIYGRFERFARQIVHSWVGAIKSWEEYISPWGDNETKTTQPSFTWVGIEGDGGMFFHGIFLWAHFDVLRAS